MTMTRLIILNTIALGAVVLMLVMSVYPVNIVIAQGAAPPTGWGMFLLRMQVRPWEALVDGVVLLVLGLDVAALVQIWKRR